MTKKEKLKFYLISVISSLFSSKVTEWDPKEFDRFIEHASNDILNMLQTKKSEPHPGRKDSCF